ncbi:RNA polymerase sigma factor [Phragmitibacter flavus]|nr:sigma-70 family RNA polymerase sigma factor [Phragmitibacter flavus]
MASDLIPVLESDESLLHKAGKGDAKAFGKLYDRMSPPLFGLLRQILGDEKDAEDTLQDGFVYLWQKASSYDSNKSKAFTWAVMIFRNKAIDKLRARGRRAKASEAVALEQAIVTPTPASPINHEIGLHERASLLRNALHLLPEQQRRLIEFAFLSGETHETIAQKLDMPLGTVKTNIRRGMLRLRDLMKGGEDD